MCLLNQIVSVDNGQVEIRKISLPNGPTDTVPQDLFDQPPTIGDHVERFHTPTGTIRYRWVLLECHPRYWEWVRAGRDKKINDL